MDAMRYLWPTSWKLYQYCEAISNSQYILRLWSILVLCNTRGDKYVWENLDHIVTTFSLLLPHLIPSTNFESAVFWAGAFRWCHDVSDGASNHAYRSFAQLFIQVQIKGNIKAPRASLTFVRGIHQWPVNSPHKWPVTRKMFPFDDVIIWVSSDAIV